MGRKRMPDYRRFIAYFYEYIDGSRQRNAGFVKAEQRGGVWQIMLQLKGRRWPEEELDIWGYRRGERRYFATLLARGYPKRDCLIQKFQLPEGWTDREGKRFEELDGMWIPCGEKRCFLSQWREGTTEIAKLYKTQERTMEILKEKAEKTLEEKVTQVREEEPKKIEENSSEEKIEEVREERPEKISEEKVAEVREARPAKIPEEKPEKIPEARPAKMPEEKVAEVWEAGPEKIPEARPAKTPEEKVEEVREEGLAKMTKTGPAKMTEVRPAKKSEVRSVEISKERMAEIRKEKGTEAWQKPVWEEAVRLKREPQECLEDMKRIFDNDDKEQETKPEEESCLEQAEIPSDSQKDSSAGNRKEEEPQEASSSREWDGEWKVLQSRHPLTYPLERKEYACVGICPGDVLWLRQQGWPVGKNSFLMQGFLRYRHLLLGRSEDGSYILGVPGNQDVQTQKNARAFGYGVFQKTEQEGWGYWCREIS